MYKLSKSAGNLAANLYFNGENLSSYDRSQYTEHSVTSPCLCAIATLAYENKDIHISK